MAHAQKVEEEKRRVDNIITLQRGDSQESLEKVSNFYLSPAYIISSFYPFFCSFLPPRRKWRVASKPQRCVEKNRSGPVECNSLRVGVCGIPCVVPSRTAASNI